jgi:Zn-dependent M16 (insulinase) family peptidase
MIGAIGEMDAYQLPDAQGYTSMLRYLLGVSDEDRQQRRDQVLSTTQADFRQLRPGVGAGRRFCSHRCAREPGCHFQRQRKRLPVSLEQLKVL